MSNHFDGKKFYNPTLKKQFAPGFSHMVRMLRERRTKWPKKVENVPRDGSLVPAPDQLTLTFINHATFLIQFPGFTILTDPVWSERASPVSWFGPKRVRKPGIPLQDLPPIDLILISHNHYDHLDVHTLKKLNNRFSPPVLAPLGNGKLLQSLGFEDVTEMGWWEDSVINENFKITLTPAQHFSARGLWDRYQTLWGSYYIQDSQNSVYYGADSGYASHFKEIQNRVGPPDVALLGIGAYEPGWFMSPIHTNPAEAVQAHQDLDAHVSIAMHYGTFPLAAEGIDQPVQALNEAKEKAGLDPEEFIVLPEGHSYQFEK